MRLLLTISLYGWLLAAHADDARLLVQSAPLAGSQYYALDEVMPQMQVGDALDLVREPDNPHDANAIRVEWQGRKLGYVPRARNRAVAAAMDAGDRLTARVSALNPDNAPWRRLAFEVFADL